VSQNRAAVHLKPGRSTVMTFLRLLRSWGPTADRMVRLAAPKGVLTIEILPAGPDGAPPKMPSPLSPAYAVLSVDIARARLATELLTLRTRRLTAPLRLPRVLFLYLRLRQATTLANAIAVSAAAQHATGLDRLAK
jgi:hypothetical protein